MGWLFYNTTRQLEGQWHEEIMMAVKEVLVADKIFKGHGYDHNLYHNHIKSSSKLNLSKRSRIKL